MEKKKTPPQGTPKVDEVKKLNERIVAFEDMARMREEIIGRLNRKIDGILASNAEIAFKPKPRTMIVVFNNGETSHFEYVEKNQRGWWHIKKPAGEFVHLNPANINYMDDIS